MVGKAVGDVRLGGAAHANQVGSDTAKLWAHMRDDVAPNIGGGRVSMEEECRPSAGIVWAGGVHVGHLRAENIYALERERKFRGDIRLWWLCHCRREKK
jgi:hypothetical protein